MMPVPRQMLIRGAVKWRSTLVVTTERFHQGIGGQRIRNQPGSTNDNGTDGRIACRSRLGGLLNYYHREAARAPAMSFGTARGDPIDGPARALRPVRMQLTRGEGRPRLARFGVVNHRKATVCPPFDDCTSAVGHCRNRHNATHD